MAWLDKLREAGQQGDQPPIDPWLRILEPFMQGKDGASTAVLLDIVGTRPTTANARRLASIMRQLNFIPIKTRRFMPGGYGDTVTRGWVRPLRNYGKAQRRRQK